MFEEKLLIIELWIIFIILAYSWFTMIFAETEAGKFGETIHWKGVMASQAARYLWNLSFNQHLLLATGCGLLCFAIPVLCFPIWFSGSHVCALRFTECKLWVTSIWVHTVVQMAPAMRSWVVRTTLDFWINHVGWNTIYSSVWFFCFTGCRWRKIVDDSRNAYKWWLVC